MNLSSTELGKIKYLLVPAFVLASACAQAVLVADFTGTPLTGTAPLNVQFTESITGCDPPATITSRLWNFGDGTTSTAVNPAHSYAVGNYSPSLTISCSDGETKTAYVNVGAAPPVVTASANPTAIVLPGSTITWNSSGATSCTKGLGWSGAAALSGSEVVRPSATTTYRISCTGAGGTTSVDTVVTVN